MGIKGLLSELPGGDIADAVRFAKIPELKSHPVDIDTGTLLFQCAYKHQALYRHGNYVPAVREFLRQVTVLRSVLKWKDVELIFDGIPPKEKSHEHDRRRLQRTDDDIAIDATYIAACIKACRYYHIPFVVAPFEADSQVGRRRDNSIPVCGDSDLIGYGHKSVIIVSSYSKGEARVCNMTSALADDAKAKYPLYRYYDKFGLKVIHWWAAVMGCDISENRSGISGVGRETFLSALESFDAADASELTARAFASAIRNKGTATVRLSYSVGQIEAELRRVANWFSDEAKYYDNSGNIMLVRGAIFKRTSRGACHHMMGKSNPKTGQPFTQAQNDIIRRILPHNLLHNSAADKDKIHGIWLPSGRSSVNDCTNAELKAMIVPRGGSVTGRDGKGLNQKELRRHVSAYLHVETQRPTHSQSFDRTRTNNGIFSSINTSVGRPVSQILDQLLRCGEHEEALQSLFADVYGHFIGDLFTSDFDVIAMSAPEMSEDFIYKSFVHVGNQTNQKSIQSGLKKILEMDAVIYHSMAWGEDGASMYVLSKQRASQNHDEKTRNKTKAGEKPNFAEYLVMVQIAIRPTTDRSNGHTLGECSHIMRSYCAACKAGCGMCYHRASLLWMQHLHWGEGRPTPRPSTIDFATWVPGSNAKSRICSTIVPASSQTIMKLPASTAEASKKLEKSNRRNVNEGISARYDIYVESEERWSMLSDPNYSSKTRPALNKLFTVLRKAQSRSEDSDEGTSTVLGDSTNSVVNEPGNS